MGFRMAVFAAGMVAATAAGAQMAQAQQLDRGRVVAFSCSGCHGHEYKGAGGVPLLRGRPEAELNQMMDEFRSGQRYSTVMRRLVNGMTEAEVRAVSTYLSSLR